jgi:hypothetical protein
VRRFSVWNMLYLSVKLCSIAEIGYQFIPLCYFCFTFLNDSSLTTHQLIYLSEWNKDAAGESRFLLLAE